MSSRVTRKPQVEAKPVLYLFGKNAMKRETEAIRSNCYVLLAAIAKMLERHKGSAM